MQVVRLPSGGVVIRDEFKGSRHTIKAAFKELRNATAGRKFLVFSDVAESSLSPRDRLEKIGRTAAALVDYALFIGEKAHHGVRGAIKGGLAEEQAMAFADFSAAAKFLKPMLGPGDVVLLKADRDHQITRLFYSLLGDVRCTVPVCNKRMVCDDCVEYRNADLVQLANEQLTAVAD
jgi:UDP-N-acetylmuramoyl-tripeptide--D-alanyl-D-alanine ligase